MNSVLTGSDNTAPSTSATQYNPLTASFSGSWGSTEGQKTTPISEDIVVTRMEVYVDTAPGAAKSYTFTIRDDAANSAVSAQITGAAVTSAVFTGNELINAGSLVCMAVTPAGTPTAPTNIWWNVFYTTAGSNFLMMGQSSSTMSTSTTSYQVPCGSSSVAWDTTVTNLDIPIPSGGSLKSLYVGLDGSPGGSGKSYATSVRLNNSTDNLTATCSNTAVAANASGSVAVVAGDAITIKCVPAGTPTARRVSWCISIAPTNVGEVFMGFASTAAPSTSAVNYEGLISVGNNGWNSTESTRYGKPPALDFKDLYVRVNTAPASGKSRAFVLRDNSSDTALTCTISNTSTTASDTTHTVSVSGGGNFGSWKTTPSGTPTATAGVHIGYVIAVPQNALLSSLQDLFDQNSLNGTLWDETTALSATATYSSAGASMNLPAASVNGSSARVASDALYDLTGNHGFLQAKTIVSGATNANSEFKLQIDANNWLRIVTENGTIYAQKFIAGVRNNIQTDTYNATTHKYWQFRESGGTAYIEVSSDGSTYAELNGSANLAAPFPLTSLRVFITASTYQVEVNPGSFVFNNFNTVPSGSNYNQPLSDSATSADAIVKAPHKIVSDTGTSSDANAKAVSKPLTDAATSSMGISLGVTKYLADSVTVSEASIRIITLKPADSVTAADSPSKTVTYSRSLSDTASSADARIMAPTKILADTASSADSPTKTVTFSRSLSDSATSSEARTMAPTKKPSDSVASSDSASTTVTYHRALSDSSTPSEAAVKSATKILADTSGTADLANPQLTTGGVNLTKSLSDSVTPSDAIVKSPVKNATDSSAASEAIGRKSFTKALADSSSSADARIMSPVKKSADAVSPAESLVRSAAYSRSFADTIATAEAIIKAYRILISDSAEPLDDDLVFMIGLGLMDSVNAAEELTVKGRIQYLADAVIVTDGIRILLNGNVFWYYPNNTPGPTENDTEWFEPDPPADVIKKNTAWYNDNISNWRK